MARDLILIYLLKIKATGNTLMLIPSLHIYACMLHRSWTFILRQKVCEVFITTIVTSLSFKLLSVSCLDYSAMLYFRINYPSIFLRHDSHLIKLDKIIDMVHTINNLLNVLYRVLNVHKTPFPKKQLICIANSVSIYKIYLNIKTDSKRILNVQ